ncbi:MAG: alpha/beta hydrolase [Lachnospiraceae bacterium]|uniref:Alpha/beta hydrolase n=1 Tax=Candidatus Weimeria bifida TaxID=2599074 RepID=A0A6N7IXW0_9FIRM|nr:alpha/beta hydrolase [Candidatus Weimeria bifida]RRF94754.1 MAG: alpha/beta hydrolase [Lachnospiraceae bacterium]
MKKGAFIALGIVTFIVSFGLGAASKLLKSPQMKKYSVKWNESLGTLQKDISYGEGEAQKFDLYLPKDDSKKSYGLAVYIHAGGFTSGDKSEDEEMLSWLCSKGYVAAGINYTLADEKNHASVLTQSNEIKAAMPKVVEAAKEAGYPIDKMTIAGGSAGHALAMIYAYRDGADAPVPSVVAYGAYDKMQPFAASKRLKSALEENHVDYKYFVLPHSGHGLQNDNAISLKWIQTVEQYLDKYMPLE